jgi:5-methylcytosine-specific restriction endonuclease McrA
LKIPDRVKEEVEERDGGLCILCGRKGNPVCHYIARSQGGRGDTPKNIVSLCDECHRRYDNSAERQVIKETLKQYLTEQYPDWREDELYYRKYNF